MEGLSFTGSNGGTIFLPAAGGYWIDELDNAGLRGYYWSSTLYESNPHLAWYLLFSSEGVNTYDYGREDGRSVRPVR